jgi:hypothetical protein
MNGAWEFCAVVSHATSTTRGQVDWICRVSYFTQAGVRTVILHDTGIAAPTDVFERALAQLGAGGWELVSIDHELVRDVTPITGERFLASVETGYSFSPFGVAYLKRPLMPGRRIDEPPIEIPIERAIDDAAG